MVYGVYSFFVVGNDPCWERHCTETPPISTSDLVPCLKTSEVTVVGPLVKTEVRGFLGRRAVAKLLPQSTRNVVVTWLVEGLFLRLFPLTPLEPQPLNLHQQAIKGFLS